MMIEVNHLSSHHMITKLNINAQEGKALTTKQAATLEADHRVESFWTEGHEHEGRVIQVRLADGYNYEGRRYVVGFAWSEIVSNMKSIEQGEPDEDDAE